jgi:hypothetical protein
MPRISMRRAYYPAAGHEKGSGARRRASKAGITTFYVAIPKNVLAFQPSNLPTFHSPTPHLTILQAQLTELGLDDLGGKLV